ncbi:uncharacterized protein F5891DRAFT_743313 [Suillus fuscotomentosus]|uniref:Uncharacterized protein n=1 Tax=Suillus fuscotomentosus TaxID=1912939 RepID=A0AAD4DWF0_9AGAM|nr:uncharacterized protein F5891DRAFT_743313 [Suillus fuscotomentosus]KAG1893853.1 hypothetical protein F5891DRAFT_743313 [Suillus fuscotomentosus]
MNSFKKMFQKSNDDQKGSLKHSKSMPYGFSSEGRRREPLRDDSSKPVYRGKTPLKKSDIVYVKQAPGILDIYHGKSQHTYYHGPARANVDTRADSDLLAKFPHSPEPTEGLPRRGFRALSLNSKAIKPQIPIYNSGTSDQEAYPSIPHGKQGHEATVDQPSADVRWTPDNHTRSVGLAERIRAKSSTDRSNIHPPPAPAPPLPTTRALNPTLSRSAHSSHVNLREVPSQVAVSTPVPAHPQSYWPYSQYDEISHEQDPTVLSEMINGYPLTPVRSASCPEHTRPIYFDIDEPYCLEKTLRWYIHMALAERRPLDARAGGRYHRIVDASNMGIAPETEND